LETESSNNIELKEFIPLSKIDPVYFESAYYLGAGEGGEKPYRLLADTLAKSNRAAIAQLVTRGKEQLVLIRPLRKRAYHAQLVLRDRSAEFRGHCQSGEREVIRRGIKLGVDLIENMSDEFNPEKYRDEYRERVQAMLDEKSKGQEFTFAAPEAPRHGQIIDLMQALKQSIEKARTGVKGDTGSAQAENSFVVPQLAPSCPGFVSDYSPPGSDTLRCQSECRPMSRRHSVKGLFCSDRG
jgi:DNA end-binding protein Ku